MFINTPTEGFFAWPITGEFNFEVVGESHYQKSITLLAGYHDPQRGSNAEYRAYLIPEDTNPYDDKAVRVEINGMSVGYLSRADARSYRRRLGARKLTGQTTICNAIIRGGYIKAGTKVSYGVWLDMKPFNN